MKGKFTITGQPERLDKVLARAFPDISRSAIQQAISAGRVLINGVAAAKKNQLVKEGDWVEFELPPLPPLAVRGEQIDLDIRYEDSWLLVVNKPAGMVVHPAPGHHTGTLVNALMGYCSLSDVGGEFRPGIVHRLDKETSGLLLVAKDNAVHHHLALALKERTIKRTYLALVEGIVQPRQGTIRGPIGRHPRNRLKMAVVEKGKDAVTDYRVLRYYARHSLVEVQLQTGRTHQIRVHFSHLGRPVVGDDLYGSRAVPSYCGHLLHARTLAFCHPVLKKIIRVTAEPPGEFISLLRRLAQGEGGER